MLKGTGCLLLLLSAAIVQIERVRENCRELNTLASLCSALEYMAEVIRMELLPMPALLLRVCKRESPRVSAFFSAVEKQMSACCFTEALRSNLPSLGLKSEEESILCELHLTGDEESVIRQLEFTASRLRKQLQIKQEARHHQEKLTAALSFSSALLLIILLI